MIYKLSYFYGIRPDILENYELSRVNKMWECVTMIEAQEQLKIMTAMDWPNLKKDKRQKLHRELHRQAYPSSISKKDYITVDQLRHLVGK